MLLELVQFPREILFAFNDEVINEQLLLLTNLQNTVLLTGWKPRDLIQGVCVTIRRPFIPVL